MTLVFDRFVKKGQTLITNLAQEVPLIEPPAA